MHRTKNTHPQAGSLAAITAIALLAAAPARACWDEAAARYRVSPDLLVAIARTESALNPHAIGRNRNGSRDIGLMQINTAWLPALAPLGIGERELLEPCTNIQVGAWILAGKVQRLGYTWEAVGAYHAERPMLRHAYAERVHSQIVAADDRSRAPRPRYPTSGPPARASTLHATDSRTRPRQLTPAPAAPAATIQGNPA